MANPAETTSAGVSKTSVLSYLACFDVADYMKVHYTFKDYLVTEANIASEQADTLYSQLIVKEFKKGAFLLREGEFCNNIFFVEEGLLRVYTVGENGKEHIIQFAPEKWFFGDRNTLYFNAPSDYFVEAIEDSRVVLLEKDFFSTPVSANNALSCYNDRLLNSHIWHLQKRINMLLSASAEQRYLDFIELHPDITLRVPQWMIASYLGITPEGLSRVRRDLARQNQAR